MYLVHMKYFLLFYSNVINLIPLQVGTHTYEESPGKTRRIELIPVRTIYRGLCYKLKLSKPLLLNSVTLDPDYFIFFVSSFVKGIDELEHVDLMIAANNTWQGVVGDIWPYSKGWEFQKDLHIPY